MTIRRKWSLLAMGALLSGVAWIACDSGHPMPSVANPGASSAESPGVANPAPESDARTTSVALPPGPPPDEAAAFAAQQGQDRRPADPELLAIWASDDPLPVKLQRVAELRLDQAQVGMEEAGMSAEEIAAHREKFMEAIRAHIDEVKGIVSAHKH